MKSGIYKLKEKALADVVYLLMFVMLLAAQALSAQSPDMMSYQAVIRGEGGNLVRSSNVGMQISILQGSVTGTAVYVERHFPRTNNNGLLTIEIGDGTVVSGNFSTIDWGSETYFIKTETDLNGGANYTITGTSQLLSVPYALYAKTAETVENVTVDYADVTNTPNLTNYDTDVTDDFSGSYNDLTDKPTITDTQLTEAEVDAMTDNNGYITTEVDGSVTNEIQNLTQVLTQNNNAGATNITNLSDPVNPQDAATKAYVDELKAMIEELQIDAGTYKLKDVDGNTYNVVRIGTQTWMAENLKVTHEADGTPIPLVTVNSDWDNLDDNDTDKAYCYYNNNGSGEKDTYGALYTYAAAKDACPTGWHLPTDAEWTTLENYISNDGHSGTEGTALKATSGWHDGGNGTDNYGFSALPGGYRYNTGNFYDLGRNGYWWSATENYSTNAYGRGLSYSNATVHRSHNDKSYGYSVRCLRDN